MNVNITHACRLCLGNSELNLLGISHPIKKYVTLNSNENDICPMWVCKQCDDTVKNWEDYLSNVGKVQIIFTEQLKNSRRIQKSNARCDDKVTPVVLTETDLNCQTPSKNNVNHRNSKLRTPSKYRSYSKTQSEDIRKYLSPEKLNMKDCQPTSTNSATITRVNGSDERLLSAVNVAMKVNGEIKQKDTLSSAADNKNDLSKLVASIEEITSPLQVPITDTKLTELVSDSETDDVEIIEVNNDPIQIDSVLNDKSDVMDIIDITDEAVVVSPCNTSFSPSNNILATSKISSSATTSKRVTRFSYRLKWNPAGVECQLCNVRLADHFQFRSHVRSMAHKVQLKINEPARCLMCNRPMESLDHQCKPAKKKTGSRKAPNNVNNNNNNIVNPSTDNEKIGAVNDVEITSVSDVNKKTPLKISCKNNDGNNSDGNNSDGVTTNNADDSKIGGSVVGKVETSLACNVISMKNLPGITISTCQNNSNSNNTDKNSNNNNNNTDKNNNNNNNNVSSTSSGVDGVGAVNAVVEKMSLVTCLSCNMSMPLTSTISQEHNCKVRTPLPVTKNSGVNCNEAFDSDRNNSSVVYSKKADNTTKEKENVNKTAKQKNKPRSIQCNVCNKYYSVARFNDHMARFHSNLTNADHAASSFNDHHGSSNSMHSSGRAFPYQLAPKNIHSNNSSLNVIKDSSRGGLLHDNRPSVNNRKPRNGNHVGEIDTKQWENGPPFLCRCCNVLFPSRQDFCTHGCGTIKTFKTTTKGHSENTNRTAAVITWKGIRQNKGTQSSMKNKKRKHNVLGNKNRSPKAKLIGHNTMHFPSINHSSANSQGSVYSNNTESDFSSQGSLGTVPPNTITVNNRRPFKRTMKKTSGHSRSVIKFCRNCSQRLLSIENVRLHQAHCDKFEIVGRSDKSCTRKCPNCSFISPSFKGLLKHYKSCRFPTQQPVNNERTMKNDDDALNSSRKRMMRKECGVNSKRPSDVINSSKRDQDVRNKSLPRASPQSSLLRPNETQSITESNINSLRDLNVTYDDDILSPFNFVTHKN